MFGGTNRLDKLFTRFLRFLTQIATSIIYLIDVQKYLQASSKVDTEAAQQRLPQGVLLDSLVRESARCLTDRQVKTDRGLEYHLRYLLAIVIDVVGNVLNLIGCSKYRFHRQG